MPTITDPFGHVSSARMNRQDDRRYRHILLYDYMTRVAKMATDLQVRGDQDAKYLAAVRTLATVSMAIDSLDME